MNSLFKKILVISDNLFLTERLISLLREIEIENAQFYFASSYNNPSFPEQIEDYEIKRINVKEEFNELINAGFDIIISLHCKQLFPADLVTQIKCINVHPGLNPFNRGWFPQVFSIINGLPLGATIHEIDEKLDHGPIITQKNVEIHSWDTSFTAYNRVLEAELELLRLNLKNIVNKNYSIFIPENEGNLNLKKDFNNLCQLNLEEQGTLQYFLNKLRALTHGAYSNGFYIDPETGKKIFIEIKLQLEQS